MEGWDEFVRAHWRLLAVEAVVGLTLFGLVAWRMVVYLVHLRQYNKRQRRVADFKKEMRNNKNPGI